MQNWPKRRLPQNKTPVGTRCIQIDIPDNDEWEQQLYSEIYQLTIWMLWERDLGKSGTIVGKQWRKALKTWRHCDGTPTPLPVAERTYEMSICEELRFHNGKLQGLCCGEWTDIGGQPSQGIGGPSQPGGGTPVPGKGQCNTYHAVVPGFGAWFLPAVVNSGDTLEFSNFDGAATDASPIGRWNCPDGKLFVGGQCYDILAFDATTPVPSAPIGKTLLSIDGDLHVVNEGSFTVPPGVVNKPVAFLLNQRPAGFGAGEVTFDINFCNTQVESGFTHRFDLTASPAGWVPILDGHAVWTAGSGFTDGLSHNLSTDFVWIGIKIAFPHRVITSLKAEYAVSEGTFTDLASTSDIFGQLSGTTQFEVDAAAGAIPTSPWIWTGSKDCDTLAVELYLSSSALGGGGGGGAGLLATITVTGDGSDPF